MRRPSVSGQSDSNCSALGSNSSSTRASWPAPLTVSDSSSPRRRSLTSAPDSLVQREVALLDVARCRGIEVSGRPLDEELALDLHGLGPLAGRVRLVDLAQARQRKGVPEEPDQDRHAPGGDGRRHAAEQEV